MSEHRIEKIESLIHQVLGEMIQREFTPPEGALVSLTRIAVSGNLQEAKVYISVIPDRLGNEVVGNLQKNAWRFQEELNEKVKNAAGAENHFCRRPASRASPSGGNHYGTIEKMMILY